MGKKKFIEKKKSATFQLLARDTSLPSDSTAPPPSDRVFVRVDNNPYSIPLSFDVEEDDTNSHADQDPNSIFADAPDVSVHDSDFQWVGGGGGGGGGWSKPPHGGPLSDHVRKEILELGLPDDGYNYLLHLREIKNSGGGSSYFTNSKARMDLVPLDVKGYDASRLRISKGVDDGDEGESKGDLISAVASKTVGVRVQKAVDADVAKLLDDGEFSRFGSDVEDLEEDFVIQANLPDEGEDEEDVVVEKMEKGVGVAGWLEGIGAEVGDDGYEPSRETENVEENGGGFGGEKQRVRRLLDAQFDTLALREYGTDSDSDDDVYVDNDGDSLAAKVNNALKDYPVDELDLEDKYKVPGDYLRRDQGSSDSALINSSAEVIRKCIEYAEMYSQEDQDNKDVVVFDESSDESEVWDCETIVTTFSNLDNHPGKIHAPGKPRHKLPESTAGDSSGKSNVIMLRGKEKLPVDFLPNSKRTPVEKARKLAAHATVQLKKRTQEESKEEKKERKAAVKEEKREARRTKKELKGLYRCEAQRAQKVAAVSGPSSIHLM